MWTDIPAPPDARKDTSVRLSLNEYDHILVMFSGGKDSEAATLHILDLLELHNVPRARIELWHQLVDGAPEEAGLMDWPVTHAYCEAFATAMGLPIRFMWREGGFEREMLRDGTATAPVTVQQPDGTRVTKGGDGPPGTRLKFPQVSADLAVRWCSAYLKIDVAARAITMDPRFTTGRILVITGERREESGARAKYAEVERHRTSNQRRRVDHWRPVLGWTEERVWMTLRNAGIVPHPCYYCGYSRGSCGRCIFGQKSEWATTRALDGQSFENVAAYEELFGVTIHRTLSVRDMADKGDLLVPMVILDDWRDIINARVWNRPIRVPSGLWRLPPGAYRHSAGPT